MMGLEISRELIQAEQFREILEDFSKKVPIIYAKVIELKDGEFIIFDTERLVLNKVLHVTKMDSNEAKEFFGNLYTTIDEVKNFQIRVFDIDFVKNIRKFENTVSQWRGKNILVSRYMQKLDEVKKNEKGIILSTLLTPEYLGILTTDELIDFVVIDATQVTDIIRYLNNYFYKNVFDETKMIFTTGYYTDIFIELQNQDLNATTKNYKWMYLNLFL